jgi:shikimate dehydrogenase
MTSNDSKTRSVVWEKMAVHKQFDVQESSTLISSGEEVLEPTMLFVGVSTSKSFVHRVFPSWLKIIGRDAKLRGVDINLNSPRDVYRNVVRQIESSENLLGALVTSHKANIFDQAADIFSVVGPYARALREVGVIYKQGTQLTCDATDPFSTRKVLNELLSRGYWSQSAAHALILGSGGAGIALAYAILADAEDSPSQVLMTDVDPARVDVVKSVMAPFVSNGRLNAVVVHGNDTDTLMAKLPEGSLIVNATGLGKDRPGSPISSRAHFPRRSIVWEFNYRGDLQFLQMAKSQAEHENLTVEDGWNYFIYGWAYVMSRVFDFVPNDQVLDQFASIANAERD